MTCVLQCYDLRVPNMCQVFSVRYRWSFGLTKFNSNKSLYKASTDNYINE